MNLFSTILLCYRQEQSSEPVLLGKFLTAFACLVGLQRLVSCADGLGEHVRREHSWMTGFYWVFVTMSTLGYGDVAFTTDIGRIFSVVVLLSGTTFMLVLLPFMFIQFFYLPWMSAQSASRAPREVPDDVQGHVVLTSLGSIESSLIRMLKRSKIPYVVTVAGIDEALRLHDEGVSVLLGEVDDPATYRNASVERAALVVAPNAIRQIRISPLLSEISPSFHCGHCILTRFDRYLAIGRMQSVLQLGEMLGQAFAACLGRVPGVM